MHWRPSVGATSPSASKEIFRFYTPRMSIAVFTTLCHWTCPVHTHIHTRAHAHTLVLYDPF